jgi:cytoskeleton protein RodZ
MIDGTGEAVPPPQPDSAAQGAAPQTPGALLQQERIRRGLSVQQSAEGLHLDTWIVEAIESNHFLALGAPVYARGYLRKYAVLLGLAPDVIVARYELLTDTPAVPTPVPIITTTPPPRPKWPKYLAWGVLAAIVIGIGVLAYELLMPAASVVTQETRPTTAVAPASTPMSAPAVESQATPPQSTPVAREPQRVSSPVTTPARTTQAAPIQSEPASVSTPAPAVVADGPLVRLRLEFNEASWVEVYDAGGQRLLYDVGQPGRPRVVAGPAPLNVVVGLAAAVSVQVNDQPILVPRRANRDSTRFRVGADGAVQ